MQGCVGFGFLCGETVDVALYLADKQPEWWVKITGTIGAGVIGALVGAKLGQMYYNNVLYPHKVVENLTELEKEAAELKEMEELDKDRSGWLNKFETQLKGHRQTSDEEKKALTNWMHISDGEKKALADRMTVIETPELDPDEIWQGALQKATDELNEIRAKKSQSDDHGIRTPPAEGQEEQGEGETPDPDPEPAGSRRDFASWFSSA